MIAYFDTSALVKLLVVEPGSEAAEAAWYAADVRVCCTVGHTEAAAAIGRAWRMGRFGARTAHEMLLDLDGLWQRVARIPVDDELARDAAQLAVLHGLRGYDAVHLAAATAPTATLVAGDVALLEAARTSGLAIIDASR